MLNEQPPVERLLGTLSILLANSIKANEISAFDRTNFSG